MSWESILKKLPNNLDDLSYKINGGQGAFDRLLRTIDKFPKLTPNFKTLMGRFASGDLTVDSFYRDLAPGLDPEKLGLAPKEVAQERLDILLSKLNLTEDTSPEKIVDEGLELLAQEERDEAKISEIAEKLKNVTIQGKKNRKNREIQRKIDVFMRSVSKSEITFKKIPEKGKEKQKFLRLITKFSKMPKEIVKVDEKETIIPIGTVSGDKILSNFKSFKEFQQFIADNEEAKEFYVKQLRQYGADLSGIDAPEEGDDAKSRLNEQYVQGVRYQAVEVNTYAQVNSFLEVLEQIPIAITKFMPSEMKSGGILPPNFFLTPESAKNASKSKADGAKAGLRRLNLNPYANTLLRQSFDGKDWFSYFFESVRISEGTKEDLANRMLYEDIYAMLKFDSYQSSFGFDRLDFTGLEVRNLEVESAVPKIKRFIEDSRDLSREFRARSISYRDRRLSEDLEYLSPAEVKAMMQDEVIAEGLELSGYKFIPLVYDDEGRIVESDSDKAVFFKITLNDEEITPDEFQQKSKENFEEDITGPLQQIRRFLSDEGIEFSTYLLSLGDRLQELMDASVSGEAFYLSKLNPDNSIQFLSKMSERITPGQNGPVREGLLAIVQEDTLEGKQEKADELNIKMPEYLEEMKKEMFSAFTIALNKFGQNYVRYARKPEGIEQAIELFKEKGLLTGGE